MGSGPEDESGRPAGAASDIRPASPFQPVCGQALRGAEQLGEEVAERVDTGRELTRRDHERPAVTRRRRRPRPPPRRPARRRSAARAHAASTPRRSSSRGRSGTSRRAPCPCAASFAWRATTRSGRPVREHLRDGLGEGLRVVERHVGPVQRHVDLHALGARALGERAQADAVEHRAQQQRDVAALHDRRRRARVEVEHDRRRRVRARGRARATGAARAPRAGRARRASPARRRAGARSSRGRSSRSPSATQSGRCDGARFSKNVCPPTPFGQRTSVIARPCRCGTSTGAIGGRVRR